MGRPSLCASRMRKRRAQESENDKDERLKHNTERNRAQSLGESFEDREERLSQMCITSMYKGTVAKASEHSELAAAAAAQCQVPSIVGESF
ncbi:unnamed protein product [Arctia plantaginis]|uniref:Uncharacterized protein n=1 Tax=Arctia plantaginis TaxID=874455 RepID=A0A8S0YY55_ARCPL|nr:unnamed protein product [Arctia plantaginis]